MKIEIKTLQNKTENMIEPLNVYFHTFLFLFLFLSLWHTNDQSSADAVSHVFKLLFQFLLDLRNVGKFCVYCKCNCAKVQRTLRMRVH